jgi:protein gp37
MGETTAIEWTGSTWNPWQGCPKVSAGCRFCYMYREKKRYGQDPTTVVRSKPPTFRAPLKWKDPGFVFVCSWSDFFVAAADAWRPDAWDIIRRCRHLTFQIPTKRPERIASCLPPDWGSGYPNVWLLASVEDQDAANARIPHLLNVPAAVHGLSIEPLLGPVNLARIEAPSAGGYLLNALAGELRGHDGQPSRFAPKIRYAPLRWVIVGGESGPFARPMHPDWARFLRNQATSAGIPFFFKQWGEWKPTGRWSVIRPRGSAGKVETWEGPPPVTVAIPSNAADDAGDVEVLERVGKKAAGAELDGSTWKQMPEPR